MKTERQRMEYQNRNHNATWFQRNELRPSMTAQACPRKNGYAYEVYDVSGLTPYKPVLTGWAPNMGRAMRKIQAYFRSVQ